MSNKLKLSTFIATLFATIALQAQVPTINPTMSYNKVTEDDEGNQIQEYVEGETKINDASCPLEVNFFANAENADGYDANYEWRFYKMGTADGSVQGNDSVPFLIRYEENTNYTFLEYGSTKILLYATFSQNGKILYEYTEEYWADRGTDGCLTVATTQSKLAFPNAFSPNGDHINDVFKAKKGYKSIIEFHAYIYNRWGQKLYDWTDPAGGWDGTYNGKDVKQGVYFLYCKAKGSDGYEWEFRHDINLLRGYHEDIDAPTR